MTNAINRLTLLNIVAGMPADQRRKENKEWQKDKLKELGKKVKEANKQKKKVK